MIQRLALAKIIRKTDLRRFHLVTPYLDEIHARNSKTWDAEGFTCATSIDLARVQDRGKLSQKAAYFAFRKWSFFIIIVDYASI